MNGYLDDMRIQSVLYDLIDTCCKNDDEDLETDLEWVINDKIVDNLRYAIMDYCDDQGVDICDLELDV